MTDPLLILVFWCAWGVVGAVLAPGRGYTRLGGFTLGFIFSFFGVGYLLLRPRVDDTDTKVPGPDPIVVRTYPGGSIEDASRAFAEDARTAHGLGYAVLSQTWTGSALSVTYQHRGMGERGTRQGATPVSAGLATLGGSVIAAVGTVAPWVSLGFLDRKGVDTPDGFIVLVLAVVGAITGVVIGRTPARWPRVVGFLVSAAIVVIAVVDLVDISRAVATAPGATAGIGLPLCIAGGVLGAIGAIAARAPRAAR